MKPYATVAELQAAWKGGAGSPSAYLAATFARIDALDPLLHAFIAEDRHGATEAAMESDRRVGTGAARPLEGIPVAVKSNIAVASLPWDAGMELYRNRIAAADAAAVARLRAAGAIILGTLNMEEAALGATTDNPWFGRTLNPHGPLEGPGALTPGGSSGGSGAAVAAGLAVLALGTDTLGSVRIPAAYNGVYGLKPTNGAIDAEGLLPLSPALDCIGPLARSLADLKLAASVLMELPESRPISRILLLHNLAGVECEPAVLAAYASALDAVAGLPRQSIELADPPAMILGAAFNGAGREFVERLGADWERQQQISPYLRALLQTALDRPAERRHSDQDILARNREMLRQAIRPGSALLLPAAPQAAFAHGTMVPRNQAAFTGIANVAGLPAIAIPAGCDEAGRPVAVQLLGAPGAEAALLAFAETLDAALGGYVPPPID